MILGFMYYLTKVEGGRVDRKFDFLTLWLFVLTLLGLTGSFLFSGKTSAPRRWAEHLPEWIPADVVAALFGIAVTLTFLLFVVRFLNYSSKIGSKVTNTEDFGTPTDG